MKNPLSLKYQFHRRPLQRRNERGHAIENPRPHGDSPLFPHGGPASPATAPSPPPLTAAPPYSVRTLLLSPSFAVPPRSLICGSSPFPHLRLLLVRHGGAASRPHGGSSSPHGARRGALWEPQLPRPDYSSRQARALPPLAGHAGSCSPGAARAPPLRRARKPRACERRALSGRRRHSASSAGSPRSGPAAPARLAMQIFVKTLTGKTITLEVSRPCLPALGNAGMRRESPGCVGKGGPELLGAAPNTRCAPQWPWQHRACAGSSSWFSGLSGQIKMCSAF